MRQIAGQRMKKVGGHLLCSCVLFMSPRKNISCCHKSENSRRVYLGRVHIVTSLVCLWDGHCGTLQARSALHSSCQRS